MPMESTKSTANKPRTRPDTRKQGGRQTSKGPVKNSQAVSEQEMEIKRLRRQVDDLKAVIREKLFGDSENQDIIQYNKEQNDDAMSCRTAYIDCDEFSDNMSESSSDDSVESVTTVVESFADLPDESNLSGHPNSGVFEKFRKTVYSFSNWGSPKDSLPDMSSIEKKTEIPPSSRGDFGVNNREASSNNVCENCHCHTPTTRRSPHPDDEEFKNNKCLEIASKELKELSHLIKWHENHIAEAQKTYENLQSECETLSEQSNLEESNEKFKNFMRKICTLKTELDEISKPGIQIASQAEKINHLKLDVRDKGLEIKKLREQLQRALTACHERHSLINDMGNNIKKMKEEANQRKLKIGDLKKDLLRASSEIQRLKKANAELIEAKINSEKSSSEVAKLSVWQAYNCRVQFRTKYSKATAMLQDAEDKISGLFTSLEELLRRACDFYVNSNLDKKQIPKEVSFAMASTVLQVESKDVAYLLEKKNDQKPSLWIDCCIKLSNTPGFPTEISGMLFQVLKVFFTGSFIESKT